MGSTLLRVHSFVHLVQHLWNPSFIPVWEGAPKAKQKLTMHTTDTSFYNRGTPRFYPREGTLGQHSDVPEDFGKGMNLSWQWQE